MVSIIIPTFNRSKLLIETLQSILFQSFNNWECIVVDDGSLPNEIKKIESYVERDSRFLHFKRPKNRLKGMNSSRNFGLQHAKGDFVVFLDSDDLLKPFFIEQRVKYLLQYPEFDFLVFQTELFNHKPGDLGKVPNVLFKKENDINRFLSYDYPWNTIGPIYKLKKLKEKNIQWNEQIDMHQDIDFHINILTNNFTYKKIQDIPDVFIRMGNDDKVSLESNNSSSMKSNVRLISAIKTYLLRSNNFEKEFKIRLYGLAIYYAKSYWQKREYNLIRKTAKILSVSNIIFRNDICFQHALEPSFFKFFWRFTGVHKRLLYAAMKNSTLAKYTIEEEEYHDIKVVHISTQESGGAGIAASRLHIGLQKNHVPSSFLTLKKTTVKDENVVNFKNHSPSFIQKVSNIFFNIQEKKRNQKKLLHLTGQHEGFSFATSDYRLHEHPLIKHADIIHLHWVSGFMDYPSFFKNIKKPIVWTLHDMNPFQGGFHYKEDEIRNKKVYGKLDNHIKELKKKAYRNSSLYSIVSPSIWLLEASKKSDLLGRFSHIHIANGVDSEVFKLLDKNDAREQLGLPLDRKILLFVSESLENKRKQFDVLSEAFSKMKRTDFILVAVGMIPSNKNSVIHYIGTVNDENKMVKLFNAADAFILPSYEDNLPNVMLESLMCGTPVIATPVGGMKEVIEHGVNGYLASENNAVALKNVLDYFLNSQDAFDRKEIRKQAIDKFDLNQQANAYKNLYTSIVSEEN